MLHRAPKVALRSLLAYTPLGGWASQSEEELEESGREGKRGGVLCRSPPSSEQLAIFLELMWLLQACSRSSGLESVSVLLWLHHFHTPIHFLNLDTFSVNEKTNIQDIRMLLRRHYRQLLMATYTTENTH